MHLMEKWTKNAYDVYGSFTRYRKSGIIITLYAAWK